MTQQEILEQVKDLSCGVLVARFKDYTYTISRSEMFHRNFVTGKYEDTGVNKYLIIRINKRPINGRVTRWMYVQSPEVVAKFVLKYINKFSED